MYRAYQRLALVAPSRAGLEGNGPAALGVACFRERWAMRYEEILGSGDYLRRLVKAAAGLREDGLELAESTVGDFLIVPAGGEV